jgi:imidazolonepropionase-like amidohydrolase
MARVLFANGRILTCEAADQGAFDGDILVDSDKIVEVKRGRLSVSTDTRVIDLAGSTVMPGLGDAHVHFGQPLDFEYDYGGLIASTAEDAALATAGVARQYIEHGITTCVSGGIAQPRGDVALKNVIERGWALGPRMVAGGGMISDPDGIPAAYMPTTVEGIRRAVAEQCDMGVEVIKMFLSGETVMPPGAPDIPVDHTFPSEALVEAAVDEAAKYGAFVHSHSRGAKSVTLAAKCGVRLISHASYVDEEGLAALRAREDVWVCPGLHYMWAMPNVAAEPYASLGKPYAREFDDAVKTVARLVEAGIKVLPGGDYGHVWLPHGEAAKDLQEFVQRCGMSTKQAVISATNLFGGLTGMKVGQLRPGYFADMLILDGDPTRDITLLQDKALRRAVVKGGALGWVNPERIAVLA